MTDDQRAKSMSPEAKAARRAKAEAKRRALAVVPAQPMAPAISASAIESLIEASRAAAAQRRPENSPFQVAQHPPKATPGDGIKMAMDESLNWASTQWASAFGGVAAEGLLFLGYPYLAELAQRPEYRIFSETIADDATRKWIDFEVVGDEAENERRAAKDPDGEAERMADPDERKKRVKAAGKTDKVKALVDDQNRLEVRDRFYANSRDDGFFGRTHLYLDFGTDIEGSPDELKTSIGNGRDTTSLSKVKGQTLRNLKVIEPVWTYPTTYNAQNPLRHDWYNPQVWYVMGKEIHASRIPSFVGHPVPDMLKPAYSFGGLSLSQMAKPYVDIWLTTRQSIGDLIHAFSVMVLQTDLQSLLAPGGAQLALLRASLFNEFRDNQGLFLTDKSKEDFKNVSVPLSGLHELQAQAQEHMASVARLPLVKFTGISPAGLNASSEGEIAVYDDTIAAYQNRFFRPNLTRVINFEQIALWGEVDPQITYVFNPLRVMTEKEKGEQQKAEAERDNIYVSMGALSPEEVRGRVIDDPELPYAGLDPEDVPDLADEEDEGLMPGGKQPGAERDDEGGGANDAVIPFALAHDAGWNEGDHPRGQPGNAGQFGPGGGGGKGTPHAPQFGLQHGVFTASGGGSPKPAKTNVGPPLAVSGLKKVGGQKGSNPGGVYEDAEGQRFYIKQGKSKDHVRNEMIAASLYDLAGTPTLQYRPVEGGGHVATEMAKLDKDNASKLSPGERKQAAQDFAVHAWLANWDAVGLGGDNLGTVNGKPTALDLGGALEYRAQGAPKGKAFGTSVGELDTLRDPSVNKDAAGIFGAMTPAEMRESARFVTDIPDQAVKAAVSKAGGSEALADKLIARKHDVAAKARFFGAEGDPRKPDGTMVIPAGEAPPIKTLNGVKFDAWDPPQDWASVDGQIELEEPEFILPKNKAPASGVVIREPDGRVWMVQPRGGFGGYEATFPKGRLEEGLSPQANAIKEAWEESGLKVRIVGHAGDHEGDVTMTRYYLAEREGGDPSTHDKETEGVVLAPKDKADRFLNRKRDREVLAQDEAGFQESKHPRDADGKFSETAGGGAASGTLETLAKYSPKFAGALADLAPDLSEPEYAEAVVKAAALNDGTAEAAALALAPDQQAFINQKFGSIEAAWKQFKSAPTFGSKKEHVAHLLTQGTTTEEILKATGWPSVSVPAMAKAAGLKLEKYKEGGVTKYKGTLMTAEEKAAAKAEAIAKSKTEAEKAGIAPPKAAVIQQAAEITGKPFAEVAKAVPKQTFPKATPAELEKAKKSIPLQLQYVPGAPQTPEAQKLVDKFNEKYANKTLTPHLTPGALEQKVQDFKQLQADMVPLMTAQQQAQVKAQAEAQAKAAAQAQAQKVKEAAAAKEAAEKNKAVMAELGINDQEAVGFVALAKMMGGSQENLVANFKKYEKEAEQYGYPISGFQCALIKNYSNGGYGAVNEALRKGSITEAQHVYTKMVNKALAGMPRHTGMLNRGTSLTSEQQALYIAGNVVEERAFTSSSTGGGFGGNTSYKIKAIGKRGASIKQLSNHSSENEVLFAARTFFKVTKVEGKPGGNMVVHMEEMDD